MFKMPKLKEDVTRMSLHGEALETELGTLRASSVRGTNVSRVRRSSGVANGSFGGDQRQSAHFRASEN